MLHMKTKKITVSLCLISVLFSPVLSQAAPETGTIAATKAADQKAALAKKAAERQKAAEEKKAAEEALKEKTTVK